MYGWPIHVIWTTYMTWPPGEGRGHWSPLFDLYGGLVEQGHRLNIPDRATVNRATELAKEPPRVLTSSDQEIVADTIGEVLNNQMESSARIYAAAIERTHVHVLLGPLDENIERVVGRLKGRTSSAVVARGSEPGRKRTWTAGYWKVFLYDSRSIRPVMEYIEAHNLRRGLMAAPYQWITPVG